MAFTSQPMNSFHFATSGFVIVALTKAERNRDSAWDMLDSGAQWAKQQRQFREGESGMKKNRYFPFPLLPLSSRSADLFHREEPRGVGACRKTVDPGQFLGGIFREKRPFTENGGSFPGKGEIFLERSRIFRGRSSFLGEVLS